MLVQIAPGMYNEVQTCCNLGAEIGVAPGRCCGQPEVPLYRCAKHGTCTIVARTPGTKCCNDPCPDYGVGLRWSYGVTTHPSRKTTLLPRTLASLAAGGFHDPWLFVDGPGDYSKYPKVTQRSAPAKVHGNWILSLYELYIRDPIADRYAVFQDDVIVYRNLRQYLETCKYPDKGYMNLYTEPRNEEFIPSTVGWYPSNQRGLGALALVFTRWAVLHLLTAEHMVKKPIPADPTQVAQHAAGLLYRGEHAVDGGIVTSFTQAGWKEYVHRPSLVQHTGHVSSFRPEVFPTSQSFRGEAYDATLLSGEPYPR